MACATSTGEHGTFVTLVSGNRFVGPALCLRRQLTRVGTRCPVHLVIDDRKNGTLSPDSLRQLHAAYGDERIISLNALIARARNATWPVETRAKQPRREKDLAQRRDTRMHRPKLTEPTPAATLRQRTLHGRRLLAKGEAAKAGTTAKVWLWAMDTERFQISAFLDLDTFIARNIDDMLTRGLSAARPFAAVSSCSTKGGDMKTLMTHFNGGVFVFRPSLAVMVRLAFTARFILLPWRGFIPHTLRWHVGYAPLDLSPPPTDLWPDICAPVGDELAFSRLFPRNETILKQFKDDLKTFNWPLSTGFSSFRACRVHHGGSPAATQLSLRLPLACEPRHTDQSVFNFHFGERRNWEELGPQYNVGWRNSRFCRIRNVNRSATQIADDPCPDAALVHFIGEPKPWTRPPKVHDSGSKATTDLTAHWHQRLMSESVCGDVFGTAKTAR